MSTDVNKNRTLAYQVEEWVGASVGYFNIRDIYTDLRIETREGKVNTSQILGRMVKEKKVQRKAGKNGEYRRVATEVDEIDWVHADPNNILPLRWVFGLERYVSIYPKNIVVIAGAPDGGKTALLLNFIHKNQAVLPEKLNYFNSEMGAEEMKNRISKSGIPFEDWNFNTFSRSANFSDVIHPDAINVIDFLEISRDFFEINQEIRNIFENLNKGIAVIAIQKKKNTKDFKGNKIEYDLGRGAEFALEKPRLYLSLDSGVCKIVKGKNWVDLNVNPNGMEFKFKLVNGYKFIYTDNHKQMSYIPEEIPDDFK